MTSHPRVLSRAMRYSDIFEKDVSGSYIENRWWGTVLGVGRPMRKLTQYSRREMMEPGGQGHISGSVGKCLDHGYILKLELTAFPDRLDLESQTKCKA